MQHRLTLQDVSYVRDKIVNITLRLRLWQDGENPDVDPAVVIDSENDFRDFTQMAKTKVVGKTTAQLLARFEAEMTPQIQTYIDNYKYQERIRGKPALATSIGNIQSALVSSKAAAHS